MQKKSTVLCFLSVFIFVALMSGCASMTKPSESNFKAPTVALSHVEVPNYFGWWYYSPKVEPTKGKAGHNSSPLILAFIYDINNPNGYPVEMQNLKFTVALEEFALNTVNSAETQWIPPGKTNQVRVPAVFGVRTAQLSLLVTGGFKLKEKGVSFWDALEKWWTTAPDFAYPINVQEGAAVFSAGGVTKVVPFEATFP